MSRTSSQIQILDVLGNIINPATDDTLTDGSQVTSILDIHGNPISVQHPIPTDGDSIYDKDIKNSLSDIGTFTGDILSLFNNLDDVITDATATNPKYFEFFLERPLSSGVIGINTSSGNFGNVKIILKNRQNVVVETIDDSANNTKYTSKGYPFSPKDFCCVRIEFHTIDEVNISGLRVQKENRVIARLQALKPDNTLTNINATAGGNLKVAVEEFDEALTTQNVDRTTNLDDEIGLNVNAMAFGRVSDTVVKNSRLDSSTEAVISINYEHHEVHAGSHYEIRINKDIPNGGTYNLAFTTANLSRHAHMIFGVSVELEADIILYENIASFAGGTAITPINNNRNSVNVSDITDMAFDVTPTLGTPTILGHSVIGSGRSIGGMDRGSEEIVLKENTTYLFAITNQATGASNEANINLTWYEHTSRN